MRHENPLLNRDRSPYFGRALAALAVAMLLPTSAWAQAVDLGTLDIPSERVQSRWLPVPGDAALNLPLDTSGWQTLDVTDFGANPADNESDDRAAIQAAIDAAPAGVATRILLPAGTYNLRAYNQRLEVRRSDLVLECEDPATTEIRIHTSVGKPTGAYIKFEGPGMSGSSIMWTGGYSEGETVLTLEDASSLSVGDWIITQMADAEDSCALIDNEQSTRGYFYHLAKVTTRSGNQITIDRPLAMDYTCGGRSIRKMQLIERVGMENCHVRHEDPDVGCTGLPNSLDGCTGPRFTPAVRYLAVANGWAVNNHYEDWLNQSVTLRQTARSMFQGNYIEGVDYVNFNTQNFQLAQGAVDNIVENNVFERHRVGVENQLGAENNVVAYNYLIGGPNQERSLFNHGNFTRGVLYEGNDATGAILLGDAWWGRQGPNITAFRNRARGTEGFDPSQRHLSTNRQTSYPVGDRINVIGNIGRWIYRTPFCGYVEAKCSNFDTYTTNVWMEKNVVSSEIKIGGVNGTNCGGTACTQSGDFVGDNFIGTSAPTLWDVDSIPHSLYRVSTTPPTWWCEEACDWSDVRAGIGAFGDDWSVPLCKLPAQIRSEGGTCTPSGNVSPEEPAVPAAPILLP